ncbi:MAG: hypothetical protein EXR72_06425 [Myxococcales bacterium]|nr:hypothetical protein [Myxococcales bacterium]
MALIGSLAFACAPAEEYGVLEQPLAAYCTANVKGVGKVDTEKVYLPRVVHCENGGAPYEALKAQAIAARTYLYYKMETAGSIADGRAIRSSPADRRWPIRISSTPTRTASAMRATRRRPGGPPPSTEACRTSPRWSAAAASVRARRGDQECRSRSARSSRSARRSPSCVRGGGVEEVQNQGSRRVRADSLRIAAGGLPPFCSIGGLLVGHRRRACSLLAPCAARDSARALGPPLIYTS